METVTDLPTAGATARAFKLVSDVQSMETHELAAVEANDALDYVGWHFTIYLPDLGLFPQASATMSIPSWLFAVTQSIDSSRQSVVAQYIIIPAIRGDGPNCLGAMTNANAI